ncbi:MAG: hypothetical protein ACOX6H_01970 [Christensenellales bacterium]|jgi:hypothetical protein
MPNLSDFAKEFKQKTSKQNNFQPQAEIKNKINEMGVNPNQKEKLEQNIKANFDKFSGMDSNQLYSQLFQEAQKLKANGNFNYEAIKNAIDNMSSYITPQQKEAMLELLKQLR